MPSISIRTRCRLPNKSAVCIWPSEASLIRQQRRLSEVLSASRSPDREELSKTRLCLNPKVGSYGGSIAVVYLAQFGLERDFRRPVTSLWSQLFSIECMLGASVGRRT